MQSSFYWRRILILKNALTKKEDSYYVVSEYSSTAITFDESNSESNSQEGTHSNGEIPKLG